MPHLTAMRVSILAMNELVPMEIDESGANWILISRMLRRDPARIPAVVISIKFDYDGDVPMEFPAN